jgi:hypothetical protein
MSRIRLQIFISVSLLLFSSFNTSAQDEMGWPVEQRCLGEPTAPPEGWTFEGTIFTQNYEGIRGVNSRIKTPYFIIFDDGFAYGASASPDGRWYTVPAGRVTNATMVDYCFIVEEIRVYSTDGRRELYTLPWNITFRGGGGYAVRQIRWVDNEHFIYEQGQYNSNEDTFVVQPFTGEVILWNNEFDRPAYSRLSLQTELSRFFIAITKRRYLLLDGVRFELNNHYSLIPVRRQWAIFKFYCMDTGLVVLRSYLKLPHARRRFFVGAVSV